MAYVKPPPPWEVGRQGILNSTGARKPDHTFGQPVPVVVRIVWEHDGDLPDPRLPVHRHLARRRRCHPTHRRALLRWPGHSEQLLRLVGAVRWLAFDRTLPPPEALGRIRDAYHDYDEGGIA